MPDGTVEGRLVTTGGLSAADGCQLLSDSAPPADAGVSTPFNPTAVEARPTEQLAGLGDGVTGSGVSATARGHGGTANQQTDHRGVKQRPIVISAGIGPRRCVCDLAGDTGSIYYNPLAPQGLQQGIVREEAAGVHSKASTGDQPILRTPYGGTIKARRGPLSTAEREYALGVSDTDYSQCGNPTVKPWPNYNEDTARPAAHQFQVVDIEIKAEVGDTGGSGRSTG